jgi:drug/metabolite transporter (DMT)-like permease
MGIAPRVAPVQGVLGVTALTATVPVSWGSTYLVTTEFLPPGVAVSFLPLLSPVAATVLGWLVLGESLTPWQGVGFVLALTAVAAAQLPPDVVRNLAPTPAPAPVKGE